MSTTTAVRTQDFPRVNLLPGEIAEEQKFRSLRAILALTVVAAVAGVGGLWYVANARVGDAEAELATAQATQAALQTEIVKYAEVPLVYEAVAKAESDLELAMGQEIRYSFVLNDLSLTIPSNVWLETITVTQSMDPTVPVVTPLGTPAVGTLAVTGRGYKQNNTAAWLDSLTESPYYTDPYFSVSALGEPINDKDIVDFNSSVWLTTDAYSNRYLKTGG
jgi:Tfp pilus assembly protein PilN